MPTEPTATDPYEAVLRDLRAKRDEIDQTIRSLENLRGLPSQGASARMIEATVKRFPEGPTLLVPENFWE